MFVPDAERKYADIYCKCAEIDKEPPWCGKWSSEIKELHCVLNGGLESRDCPGAWSVKGLDLYVSSHPSVCKRGERRYQYQQKLNINR